MSLFRVLLVLALLVTGCARPSTLVWRECGDGFQCAGLAVPLDHARPYGERITISVVRLPATGDKIGSLVINPGGPGGSGIDYARAAISVLSEQVRERFDIIGFDPRGVGASAPVQCLDDAKLDAFIALDTTPDTDAERATLESGARSFATGCQALSGRLLPHVSTVSVARDMDLLRAALGEPRLTYLGKSYGTLLGAHYAELFPGRVRALVLDGALDPSLDRGRLNAEQAAGFSRAFRAYAADCDDCPLSRLDALASLLRRTDAKPLDGGGREVTEALATLGVMTPLYDRAGWPMLTEVLRAASRGDGRLLLRGADQLVGRGSDGRYTNQTEANLAVNCVDGPYPADFARAARAAGGPFGPYVMWSSLPCAYWPVKPVLANRPLHARGAPPILVLGTTRDPATPYAWSRSLAGQLSSGVLLSFEGDGHTAYFNGSSCVDDAVDSYLITTRPPRDGTVCPDIN